MGVSECNGRMTHPFFIPPHLILYEKLPFPFPDSNHLAFSLYRLWPLDFSFLQEGGILYGKSCRRLESHCRETTFGGTSGREKTKHPISCSKIG